ncbi:alpha/beta hydrolase [Fulvivirga sp. 29W222]|uniref:Alpha/beta hydrolase n=1 Tax=Fulvivirga marina TaxID=2494733 RepID=A0A937G642_9BACT|nr:alpha/beta hydrolase [Fulvivirga marina]MBL6449126.1 alpha/beta hydrolase [Fulvivirga marina]
MKRYLLIVGLCLFGFRYSASLAQSETIRFKSIDGIEMAADLYFSHPKTAPFIVLFHQANWSRGEYAEIAPRLNSMGYNCMAVDLRSGNSINDVSNITKQNALKAMKATRYVDALPDMMAAVDYAKKNYAHGKLIVWGSSYSAALALKLSGDHQEKIDAVLAFSPGEYFTSQGKPRNFISSSAVNITQPAFITSARDEKSNWWGIYVAIPSGKKSYFLPQTTGNHGSRALWSKYPDADDYWKAVNDFLGSI